MSDQPIDVTPQVYSESTEPDWKLLVPEVILRFQQEDALHQLWEAFYLRGKKVVLLEAPTGVGKSIIELALCRYEEHLGRKSFIVTPQRQLQDQLKTWEGLKVMKGRGAYECILMGGGVTANNAPCLLNSKVRESNHECGDTICPFFSALRLAKQSPTVVHNYASLMAQAHISHHFEPRELLCLDEGHTAVSWIRNYMTCEFLPRHLSRLTTEEPPESKDDFLPWIRRILSDILCDEDGLPRGLPDDMVGTLMKVQAHPKEFGLLTRGERDLAWEEHLSKMEPSDEEPTFEEHAVFEQSLFARSGLVPWTTQYDEPDRWHPNGMWTTIPLRVAPMANALLGMGRKIMMVTATVLNKPLMCIELGLKPDEVEFVQINSAFKPENRPIIRAYAGSMSYRNKKTTTPRLIDRLASIARRHENEQGLVHTVSYNLAEEIVHGLRKLLPGRPVELASKGSEREHTISRFLSGGLGPTAILVGPAMLEGVDGKDDSARWQALAKVPWPMMKDPVVDFITNRGNEAARRWGRAWYAWKTAQQAVQGFGRVCRTPADYGTTYLLDSDFDRILAPDGFVPKYVLEALR